MKARFGGGKITQLKASTDPGDYCSLCGFNKGLLDRRPHIENVPRCVNRSMCKARAVNNAKALDATIAKLKAYAEPLRMKWLSRIYVEFPEVFGK